MFLGIITEDEHRVLQLGIYITFNKYVLLPPIKGAMGAEERDEVATRQVTRV
jgi:hypothetical protein